MTETITVLHAPNRRLTKRLLADGSFEDFEDNLKLFDLYSESVACLDDIESLLHQLAPSSDCFVVRGQVIDPNRTKQVRRLLHDKEGYPATLKPVSRRWLALDVDDTPKPDDVPAADLVGCAKLAIARLPASFHGATCIAQATSGHGIKPTCRLRLWYWLSEPLGTHALKVWLSKASDDHVFNAVQAIYTATVILVDREDHLPVRMLRLPGHAEVQVPKEVGDLGEFGHGRAVGAPISCAEVEAAQRVAAEKALARGRLPFALKFKMGGVDRMISAATMAVANAPDGSTRAVLFNQARLLGGVLHTGFLTEGEATSALWNAVAHRAKSQAIALDTIATGLAVGRTASIELSEPNFPRGRPKHPQIDMSGLLRRQAC